MFWNVRAMPSRVIWCGGRPEMFRSPNMIEPLVGRYSPAMTLKNVVFPAPFGPMRLTIEPSGITKSTPATATSPPNCLVTARASRTLLIAPAQSPGFAGETRLRQRGFARRGSTAPRSSLHVHELRAFLLDGALVFLRGVQLGAHARAWEQ